MAGPNPILLLRDHMPGHIAELEAERAKLIARLLEVNQEWAVAVTLQASVPLPPELPEAEPVKHKRTKDPETQT